MAIEATEIQGKDVGKILLYALSTCAWCKKTKRFLDKLGVGYAFIDVDSLSHDEQSSAKETIKKWNPRGSYPTIIVNEKDCVVGYNEKKLKEALGL